MGLPLWVLFLSACDELDSARLADPDALLREGPIDPGVPDCRLAIQCPELAVDAVRCVDEASLFELTTLEGETIALRLSTTAELSSLASGHWFTVVGADCDSALALQFEVLPRLVTTEITETGVVPCSPHGYRLQQRGG